MKTLFLCSYFTDVASLFKTFADQNQFEKKVLFILQLEM